MTEPEEYIKSFQELTDYYESFIRELRDELDEIREVQEQNKAIITTLVDENRQLNSKLHKNVSAAKKTEIDFQYKESDYIKNLKEQLRKATDEKEYVVNLWQNAIKTVDRLEEEIKLYQNNVHGSIPKKVLMKVKSNYDEKIRNLEQALENAKIKSDLTTNLDMKGHAFSQNTMKIIENFEGEILKLQERLRDASETKSTMEILIEDKNRQLDSLHQKNAECRRKVEEAVQVVEAALNEKDASLLREGEMRDEIGKLSKTMADFVKEAEQKSRKEIEQVKSDYGKTIEKVMMDLKVAHDQNGIKSTEIEKFAKQCTILECEIERLKKGYFHFDDSTTSKLLILEKNLENTFQKLLLSEKQNIQIVSERNSIKNDLDQMAGYYERDIKAREAEKILLKSEVKKLKIEIEETHLKLAQNLGITEKLEELERQFRTKFEENQSILKQNYEEQLNEQKDAYNQTVNSLQDQIVAQIENNKKWRLETRNITAKMEKRIIDLNVELSKTKRENKILIDKINEANLKLTEYNNYLQIISSDVNKITDDVR